MSDHHRHHPQHPGGHGRGWYAKHVKFNRRRRFQLWIGVIALVAIIGILLNAIIFGDLAGLPMTYEAEINFAADHFGIPRPLAHGLVQGESSHNAEVVSRSGAIGLWQLMPATAKGVAASLVQTDVAIAQQFNLANFTTAMLKDPGVNSILGAAYFRRLLDMYNGDVRIALAGYNGGPGAANRLLAGGVVARETRSYSPKIMRFADAYAAKLGTPGYVASTVTTAAPAAVAAPIQAGKDVQIVIPDNTAPADPGVKGLFSRWFGK